MTSSYGWCTPLWIKPHCSNANGSSLKKTQVMRQQDSVHIDISYRTEETLFIQSYNVCVVASVAWVQWNCNVRDWKGARQLWYISRAKVLAQLNGRRDGTAAGIGLWLMVSLELSRSFKVSVCSWQQIKKRVWGRSYNTCVTVTRHNAHKVTCVWL